MKTSRISKTGPLILLPFVVLVGLAGCRNDRESLPIDESMNHITVERMESPNHIIEDTSALGKAESSDFEKGQDSEERKPELPEEITLNDEWQYADYSVIKDGDAVLYHTSNQPKDIVVGINAGHGTKDGQTVKTYCHPDKTPKVTGGTTPAGSTKAVAVSAGMTFADGASEADVALKTAELLRDKLLDYGYDVLMLRDEENERLDNIARTVIANNCANCIISLHWDGDNLDYDKGCFYISTPDGIKGMEPVASHWMDHEELGEALIEGLRSNGCKIYGNGSMTIDLTQTSYSTIPSVDIELGNAASSHDDATLDMIADGLVAGIRAYSDNIE